MGPRPDGRGRYALGGQGVPAVAGVNGAAAGWPRKAFQGPHGGAVMAERQWGRGRMAAEGVDKSRCISLACRCVNGAAAGWPRKGAMPGSPPPPNSASMGPRPDGRGRAGPQLAGAEPPRRQWGRGRMAAEGLRPAEFSPLRRRRQWGRGRMAAEGSAIPMICLSNIPASMGPRPDGRGRTLCALGAHSHFSASMGPRPDGRGRS